PIAELEAGLLEPADLGGDLAELYRRYRHELDRLGLWDRDLRRGYAAGRLGGELDAWDGRPVYAYGFEDLSGAQWRLLEAFAGRTDVAVSLQYEPGRLAFAAVARITRVCVRRDRRAVRTRWPDQAGAGSVRPCSALAAPLCVAGRRPPRPVRLHPVVVFGPCTAPRRLSRGPASRAGNPLARAAGSDDRRAPRPA